MPFVRDCNLIIDLIKTNQLSECHYAAFFLACPKREFQRQFVLRIQKLCPTKFQDIFQLIKERADEYLLEEILAECDFSAKDLLAIVRHKSCTSYPIDRSIESTAKTEKLLSDLYDKVCSGFSRFGYLKGKHSPNTEDAVFDALKSMKIQNIPETQLAICRLFVAKFFLFSSEHRLYSRLEEKFGLRTLFDALAMHTMESKEVRVYYKSLWEKYKSFFLDKPKSTKNKTKRKREGVCAVFQVGNSYDGYCERNEVKPVNSFRVLKLFEKFIRGGQKVLHVRYTVPSIPVFEPKNTQVFVSADNKEFSFVGLVYGKKYIVKCV